MKEQPGKVDNIDPFLQMTREDNEQKIELLNKQQQDELKKGKYFKLEKKYVTI